MPTNDVLESNRNAMATAGNPHCNFWALRSLLECEVPSSACEDALPSVPLEVESASGTESLC